MIVRHRCCSSSVRTQLNPETSLAYRFKACVRIFGDVHRVRCHRKVEPAPKLPLLIVVMSMVTLTKVRRAALTFSPTRSAPYSVSWRRRHFHLVFPT